jgi:hypothetical protein
VSIAGDVDADADGDELPLTDGILVLRWMLGFRGDSLISGALSPGCTRCDAEDIDTFLSRL